MKKTLQMTDSCLIVIIILSVFLYIYIKMHKNYI